MIMFSLKEMLKTTAPTLSVETHQIDLFAIFVVSPVILHLIVPTKTTEKNLQLPKKDHLPKLQRKTQTPPLLAVSFVTAARNLDT